MEKNYSPLLSSPLLSFPLLPSTLLPLKTSKQAINLLNLFLAFILLFSLE